MNTYERLKALSELSQPFVIQALREDCSDVVRHEAAFILGQSFAHLADSEQPLAYAATKDASVLVRHEACLSLAKFKTRTAFDAVADCMQDSAPEVRSSARYALEEMVFNAK